MAASTETDTKPFSVLFVCLGNICRSPAAEGVFTDLVKKRGLDSKFKIDSAGTINYHEGNPADPRMRASSKSRGIVITSLSRPIRSSDFVDFDLSLAMDNQNRGGNLETLCLRMLIRRWNNKYTGRNECYSTTCFCFISLVYPHRENINYGAFLEKDGAGFRGQVKLTGF
ncbi:low molecular weight phosphotyrosine protein phosphatase-like isoform X2 [Humulus lupulus]|uniref:low molecular weight phosphotyrosine protein phosphatase-like isoform X2 n=1 Tax=Humulus lupulus TaxID=3486 RepID=UPI002B4099EA|nr:low molecular weight phosphotyrosine protein phosphatase-like isoform X2 [Humulus lupulus]